MHTTAQVAKRLKRSTSSVAHVAAAHGIGTLVTARMRMFSDDDLSDLAAVFAARTPGRPRTVAVTPTPETASAGRKKVLNSVRNRGR